MNNSNSFIKITACVFAVSIILICCLPFLFTQFGLLDFNETGQIGDTIGGIMGPFVGILGAVLTFMAFWIQYQANEEQRKSIDVNKNSIEEAKKKKEKEAFDDKFMQMISIYRDNVKEIKYLETEGKEAFKELLYELKLTYELVEYNMAKWILKGQPNSENHKKEIQEFINEIMSSDMKLKMFLTETAYTFFFYGECYFTLADVKNNVGKIALTDILYKAILRTEKSISKDNPKRELYCYYKTHNEKKYKYTSPCPIMQGRAYLLGHYYRQLLSIAKYIDKSDFISFNDKYAYFKQLRLLMSDEEQVLLYYNSLSSLGKVWNNNTYTSLEDMCFDNMGYISRYKMIKNLSPRFPYFGAMPVDVCKNEIEYYQNKGDSFLEHDSFSVNKSYIGIKVEETENQKNMNINL